MNKPALPRSCNRWISLSVVLSFFCFGVACTSEAKTDSPDMAENVDIRENDAGGDHALHTDSALPDANTSPDLPALETPIDETRTLTVDGIERRFQLYVPSTYSPDQPIAVVLNFHGVTPGLMGAGRVQELISLLKDKAESAGFIAIHGQSLNQNAQQSWNVDPCCTDGETRDDLGYVTALLDYLESTFRIDQKRIYATGISNGGRLTYRLACDMADRFAAFAPVAGRDELSECEPARPVPIIAFHGTLDGSVDYEKGRIAAENWVGRNECAETSTETFRNGDSSCQTYQGCAEGVEVVLCTVEDGGHTWPGGTSISEEMLGKTTQDMSANDQMWAFFERFSLP